MSDKHRNQHRPSVGVIKETSEGAITVSSNRGWSPSYGDEDYDSDLEVHEEKQTFDYSGRSVYIKACKQHGLVPASYFLRHMEDSALAMPHHGLGPTGTKVIALPLMNNTSVLSLDIEDNWIEGEGGEYIAQMLTENCYIADVNIAWNKLGRKGGVALCDMLMSNTTLQTLNASGNQFCDKEASNFAEALKENNRVQVLNLSHNHFGDNASVVLGPALGENDTIEELDLSWNYFRKVGAKHLCDGIKTNVRLRAVDLSFNGFGNEGSIYIAELLRVNQNLAELRVCSNRIGIAGAAHIAKALEHNEGLKCLYMGHNPMGVEGAKAILKAMLSESSGLTQLDLTAVEVDKEFASVKKELTERKKVCVKHGAILGDYVIKPRFKNVLFGLPIKEVTSATFFHHLERYCEDKNINIGDSMLACERRREQRLMVADIILSLTSSGISLTEEQHSHLAATLKELEDADGFVDISPVTAF